MTALATSQGADQLGNAAALTDGYSAAFLGAAGIARHRRARRHRARPHPQRPPPRVVGRPARPSPA